jgi:hypothetical protein
MRTSLVLFANAMLAAAPLVLAYEEWWPTSTKKWGGSSWEPQTSDCDESTALLEATAAPCYQHLH